MHPNDGRVVANFVMQALRGQPITVYGNGAQTRSFCYISDMVEGLLRLMQSPRSVCGPINLGNPKQFSIRQLADTVASMCRTGPQLQFRPLPADDPQQRCPDINKARELLGWKPTISLAEGLPPTIEYFKRFVR
jgi:UDP-glucuronate decarboxylase